jgi:hypothetical protein
LASLFRPGDPQASGSFGAPADAAASDGQFQMLRPTIIAPTMRTLCDALASRASILTFGRPGLVPVLEEGEVAGATSSQSPCARHAILTPDLHTLTPATFLQ